jgi:amidase
LLTTRSFANLALLMVSGCASAPPPLLGRGIPAARPPQKEHATESVVFLSAAELVRKIQARELTSESVVRAFARQIAVHNEEYNAVVLLDYEAALARARRADEALARGEVWGPLHGLPITVKDSLSTRGLRTTAGYAPLAEHVPQQDATVVAKLREAGAILLAKTNLATLAMDMQTTNALFGTTRNPWDVNRTPGEAAAGASPPSRQV